jgi:hypothetical protein
MRLGPRDVLAPSRRRLSALPVPMSAARRLDRSLSAEASPRRVCPTPGGRAREKPRSCRGVSALRNHSGPSGSLS